MSVKVVGSLDYPVRIHTNNARHDDEAGHAFRFGILDDLDVSRRYGVITDAASGVYLPNTTATPSGGRPAPVVHGSHSSSSNSVRTAGSHGSPSPTGKTINLPSVSLSHHEEGNPPPYQPTSGVANDDHAHEQCDAGASDSQQQILETEQQRPEAEAPPKTPNLELAAGPNSKISVMPDGASDGQVSVHFCRPKYEVY